MNRLIIIITILFPIFSCDDRLEELNVPSKNATEVPGELLFTNGLREMVDLMSSTNVNENVFRLYAQYWAQTTYPDESQYNMVGRQIPDNFWTTAFRDALMDLDEAKEVTRATADALLLTEDQLANRLAAIDICKVYMFSVLVDLFGAIPYSQALNEDILSPQYEPGEEVYGHLIDSLDYAINSIVPDAPGFSDTQDLLYQGDMEGWLKFANSLKLRMAMTIADVNPSLAESMATEAIDGGLILSNMHNASIEYLNTPPNTNPVWEDLVQSGRADYVIANTIVDVLTELDDPRLMVYAEPTETGTYIGGEYGTANTYASYSHIGDLFHEPNLEGVIMSASEVQFLLAEAAARGIPTPETVEEHYQSGIRSSMLYWNIDEAAIEDYLNNPDVAYATAPGDWRQKIGLQMWIAYYNRGYEGWTTWRRLDFEGFNVPEGLSEEDIPSRLIFPIEEATLNPTNLQEAIQLIGGTDNVQTPIFWDTNE